MTRFHKLSLFSLKIMGDGEEMKAMYVDGLRCSICQLILTLDECTLTKLYN